MNIPNSLTLLRVALLPVFVVLFYLPYHWADMVSAIVFAFAAITDWLDGYLARKLDQSTPFGAFLDPVADKLMVAIALVLLAERFGAWWFTLPAVVIISREIVISALREWMAELGARATVAVSYIGKLKTSVQMLSIFGFLFIGSEASGWSFSLMLIMMYAAAILTLWSMIIYLRAAWPLLFPNKINS